MKRVPVFFYGLFMDPDLIRDQRLSPQNGRRAFAIDHDISIGLRAAMVRAEGRSVWGIAYDLLHSEIDQLYGDATAADYREEALLLKSESGVAFPALIYNLDRSVGPKAANPDYVEKLLSILEKLDAPTDYIRRVHQLIE